MIYIEGTCSGSHKLGVVVLSWEIHWPYPILVEAVETLAIKWGIILAFETCLSGFSGASNYVNIVNALNVIVKNLSDCGVIPR